MPGSSGFFAWLSRVERHDIMAVSYCNANDVSALESLYETAAGADWTESSGWLNDGPVEEWYGRQRRLARSNHSTRSDPQRTGG